MNRSFQDRPDGGRSIILLRTGRRHSLGRCHTVRPSLGHVMIAARFAATMALVAALTSCGGGQLGNPKVTDMDPFKARDMAQQYCQDISTMGHEKATRQLALRTLNAEVTDKDSEAIIAFAYVKLCPKNF